MFWERRNRCKNIVIYTILLLFSCRTAKEAITKSDFIDTCEGKIFELSVSKVSVKNTLEVIIDVEFINNCTDTLILMNGFTNVDFIFMDSAVHKSVIISTTSIYPEIDWANTSKGFKRYYLEEKCRALLLNYDVTYIGPKARFKKAFNLKSLNFVGFENNKSYAFYISARASERLKYYCPFIWSGYSKSSNYSFKTNINL